MTPLRDVPIKRKLEGIILVTSGVVLSLSLVALLLLDLNSLRAELQSRLVALAEVLGGNSTAALVFGDEPRATELLATLRTQPDVVSAEIGSLNGSVFARYRTAKSPPAGDEDIDLDSGMLPYQLAVEQPITLDGERLGQIRIVGDMRSGYAKLLQHSYLMLGVFVLSMLLALALSQRLQRIVSVPVERLLKTMEAVAETTDFTRRAQRLGNDEFGALVDGFNLMLERLEENRRQLDGYHHHLQQLVQERTADLEQRTRELNGVLSSVQDVVYIIDADGRLIFANQKLLDWLGVTAERAIGLRVRDLNSPDSFSEPLLEGVMQVLSSGAVVTNQARLPAPSGEVREFENILAPMPGPEGKTAFVAGSSRDVTDRSRVERALRESEFRYRELFDNMTAGVAVYEAQEDGKKFVFRDINRAGERIGRLSRQEHVGRELDELYPGAVVMELQQTLRHVWLTGRPQRLPVSRYRDSRLAIWVENYIFKLPSGEVVAVYDDVTDRVRAEQALRESEARLKLFVEHAPAALAMFDREMRYLAVSNRWLNDFSLAGEDVIGRSHYEIFPEITAEWRTAHRRALAGEVVRSDEDAFARADGRMQWLRWEVRPWYMAEGKVGGVVVFSEDITESRKVKQALERRTAELERMNTELEEFAYVASHDLKAPLRAVANLALVLEEEAGERLDEENHRLLRLMRERVIAMNGLIDGLLRYARIGRSERAHVVVELEPLLRELVDTLQLPEGFSVEWEPSLPGLFADPVELRQVFQNLLANAASHHDCPRQGHAWIRVAEEGERWRIEVADDGPGIPEHMRSEVFRMFSSGSEGHSGIGLAVVRKIVLANGGRVAVSNNTPRGALFRIDWPKAC